MGTHRTGQAGNWDLGTGNWGREPAWPTTDDTLSSGVLGLYLHYRGNVEFELEMYSSLRGFELFWEALKGATPALAPAAMAHLGLVGLAYSYHHPLLTERG